MSTTTIAVFLGVLVCIGIISRLLTRRTTQQKKAGVPREREALTQYIKMHVARLERAKRCGKDRVWVRAIGKAILSLGNEGLVTTKMTGHEIMAAIFAVNQHSHDSLVKDYLIGVVLTHKRQHVKVTRGEGKYAQTMEVTSGVFCSHAPIALLRGGDLDRRHGPQLSRGRWQ